MSATERAYDLTPVDAPAIKSRSRRRTLVVLVVLAAAVLALLSQGLLHSLNYFETVDQAMATRATLGTTTFRLEGLVKPHTITRTSYGASFWITGGGGEEVWVVAHALPPQLFQANIPVVVVGHFTSATSRTFDGSQIMVKHTAAYIAQYPHRVRAPNGTVR